MRYEYKGAFSVLGIDPVADKRKIKKAYAQRIRTVHPEEDPEGWKQIHDAYISALFYVEALEKEISLAESFPENSDTSGHIETCIDEDKRAAAQEENEKGFSSYFQEIKDSQSLWLIAMKQNLEALFLYNPKAGVETSEGEANLKKWILFFESEAFEQHYKEVDFWIMFSDLLEGKGADYRISREIKNRLSEIGLREGEEAVSKQILGLIRQINSFKWQYISRGKVFQKNISLQELPRLDEGEILWQRQKSLKKWVFIIATVFAAIMIVFIIEDIIIYHH